MTRPIQHRNPGIAVPRRLLYLTEPARAVIDFGLLTTSLPLLAALPRGDGHPVLVLPGLGGDDSSTITLRAVLRHLGYRTYGWRAGRNVGPTAQAVNGMRTRFDDLTHRFGARISVIGWSLGGIYAGQLARRKPDAVRQIITLASPVALGRQRARAEAARSRPEQRAVNRIYGDWSRFPQWPRWSDWSRFYAELQTQIPDMPFENGPLPVPATSIYSPLDGIVGWRACLNEPGPRTENIAVAASHVAFAYHPAVIWAIADRLAQPAGKWTPFQPPPLLAAAYLQQEGQP